MDTRNTTLFTRPFVLLCLTLFCAFATQAMMIPAIPLYVDHMGGSAFLAGLALLAFSIPTISVRPWLGRLADSWGAKNVLVGGLLLSALGSLIFLFPVMAAIFVGGIVRGLGWAGVNIGGYTVLAAVAPPHRRGEASGYYTSAVASASIVFPALALWLIDTDGGFLWVFVLCAAVSVLGVPTAVRLPADAMSSAGVHAIRGSSQGVPDRRILVATILNFTSTVAMPSAMAFMPLYARSMGIENIGYFYILAGVTNIAIRPLLGREADQMGRGRAIAWGLAVQLVGFVIIVGAQTLPLILIGGTFVSVGSALVGSATTALTMDLAHPQSRGRSMATYSISWQLGAGVGAIMAGTLADLSGFSAMFAGSVAAIAAGMLLLATTWKSLPQPPISIRA